MATKKTKNWFQDRLLLNAGQKNCRMLQGENSAIISTFIKLPFVFKTFVLSIFKWPLKTGFTVFLAKGAQWLSGKVLDLRPKGRGFQPHRHHCVVSLRKTHLSLVSTGSTQEDPSQHNCKSVEWDVKDQIKFLAKFLNHTNCF